VPDSLPADLPDQVSRALREDIGSGDVTAELIPLQQRSRAHGCCAARQAVLCGTAWFNETFRQLDPSVQDQLASGRGRQRRPRHDAVRDWRPRRDRC
jgi:nicotinate-nucleotide pyrophosphorylase (carboxylating)